MGIDTDIEPDGRAARFFRQDTVRLRRNESLTEPDDIRTKSEVHGTWPTW